MLWRAALMLLGLIGQVYPATVEPTFCPSERQRDQIYRMVEDTPAPQELIDLGETEFVQQRIDVMDGIYFYIGYGLANVIVIDAPEGLIIVDSLDSPLAMQPVLDDIVANILGDKKIVAIIYTHDHPDHVGGASLIQALQPDDPIEVWAYESLKEEFWGKWQYNRPALLKKGFRQVGADLAVGFVNAGVGPRFVIGPNAGLLTVPPTNTVGGEEAEVTIAGLDLLLIYIPGETKDHMGIYVPSMKLLLSADDVYKSFPNLYAIRGTPPRPVNEWKSSIDKMRRLDVDVLLPSHSMPVYGRENVQELLTDYRDGIQYVHDQTTRLLNRGLHTDVIAQTVELPESLRDNPYLQEMYGTVEWGSKAVTESRMGWFSGFPAELLPLTPEDEAEFWSDMFPYPRAISSIRKSLWKGTDKHLRWAVKLSSVLWNNRQNMNQYRIQEVLELRSKAMRELASIQTSANARNYLLRWVLEENCNQSNAAMSDTATMIVLPPSNLVRKMSVMLKAELLDGVHSTVVLNFQDAGFVSTMIVRNNILEVLEQEEADNPDVRIDVNLADFRYVLLGSATLEGVGATVYPSYEEGNLFMSYFDDPKIVY